jgi:Rieske Fe-S protein
LPRNYFRFDRRGNACSVTIGGEDHKTGREEETEARYERLENILKKNFPSAKPKHRWSGQVIETPDGLPCIGEVADHQFLVLSPICPHMGCIVAWNSAERT